MNRMRSGSALLIVLGMTSFMLFSGLAFAVYMRYARLPTSFLRRTTISHQLARAALAEAIEEIDKSFGIDDPHPGVRRTQVSGNYWYNRVFFGAEQTSDDLTYDSGTLATLTLEGLAYLPPNLINDVRYYSRCTPTAKWHSFWFDSGRYAYVAVDVSDYFDVNKAVADEHRTSAANGRVTLAHLFETIKEETGKNDETIFDHTGPGDASAWENLFGGSSSEETTENPFISMAQFNIAWKEGISFGGKSIKSPFRQFVESKKAQAYGQNLKADSAEAEYYRQLTFVTDSWMPAPARSDGIEVADLEDTKWQPFDPKELDKDETAKGTMEKIIGEENWQTILKDKEKKYLRYWANTYNSVALWDYLDKDKRPLSLAFPTCERVPMVCAIRPDFAGAFKIEKNFKKEDDRVVETVGEGDDAYEVCERDVTYSLKFDEVGGDLSGFLCWTYPFLLKGHKVDDRFNADGRVAIFLTEKKDFTLSREAEVKGLYLESADEAVRESITEVAVTYPFEAQTLTSKSGGGVNPESITTSIGDLEIPVQELKFQAENRHKSDTRQLVTVTFRWHRNKKSKTPSDPKYAAAEIPENGIKVPEDASKIFGLLKEDGSRDTDFSFLKNEEGKKVYVNAAIWARVTDEHVNTVDLVPACLMDDTRLNNDDNMGCVYILGDTRGSALLNLCTKDPVIELSIARFEKGGIIGEYSIMGSGPDGQTLMTGDPRFNHAPENWYVRKGEVPNLGQTWYNTEKAEAKSQGEARGDDFYGDIYMATSDQGYLQSLYELMMLPRIVLAGAGPHPIKQIDGKVREKRATLRDSAYMWNTYQPRDFDSVDDGRIVSGDAGQKVNPYSDSTNVLMAAFANTPHDWRVASTNNDETSEMGTSEFNKGYAWNSYSTAEDGRLRWGCLSEVAGIFSDWARNSSDWREAFREMQWSNSERELLKGIPLDDTDSDLYSVDKKFLYGFWHDSFSSRQQLFLIFVRAEPMMMGGGVSGQASPQLSSRAVALVWRDPNAYYENGSRAPVHRTRVLFYHTFD